MWERSGAPKNWSWNGVVVTRVGHFKGGSLYNNHNKQNFSTVHIINSSMPVKHFLFEDPEDPYISRLPQGRWPRAAAGQDQPADTRVFLFSLCTVKGAQNSPFNRICTPPYTQDDEGCIMDVLKSVGFHTPVFGHVNLF